MTLTRLSVIVPTRGPSERTRLMLRSLDESIPPDAGVEVIVVVDGLGDITPQVEGLTLDLRVLTTGGGCGAALARNRGVEIARGATLAFLGDDVIVTVGWAADVLARLDDDDWDLLGGRIGSVDQDNLVSQMFETLVIRHGRVDGRWFLASANLLVRTPALRSLRGFDERYASAGGEDWDLCRRAHREGLRVSVAEDCTVHHWNPTQLRSLTSRARSYAESSPLRFASDRPRFGGGDERAVDAVASARGLTTVVTSIPAVVSALRQRYCEVREHGHGAARSMLILAIHLPWFVTYAVSSRSALRRSSDPSAGS
jgi:GT2 family glycosyltransferase